jgi:hypothetical protein
MHIIEEPQRLVFIGIMTLWLKDKFVGEVWLPPQRRNTLQNIARIKFVYFTLNNGFFAMEFRSTRRQMGLYGRIQLLSRPKG